MGIAPINERTILLVESAFNWINDNTTLKIDVENDDLTKLPSSVKLFIVKYFDLMMLSPGVHSESIEGLSQSYDTTNKSDLLWQYANELLNNYLKSQMTFVTAKRRWK